MICLQVQEILDEDEALSTDPSQGRQRTRRVLAMRHVRYCCGQRFFFLIFRMAPSQMPKVRCL